GSPDGAGGRGRGRPGRRQTKGPGTRLKNGALDTMGCTVSRRRTTTAEASSAWGIFGFYRPRSPSPPPQRLLPPLTVMDCPICLDVAATEAQTLPCMHKFCLDCIQRWT
ncbi:hypothetical protein DC043_15480, partial [Enterococcus faecalis]